MYAEYTPNLTFVHEKANVGNPLNEAADSLAKPGLRSLNGREPVTEIPRLVPLWASGALAEAEYRRAPRPTPRRGWPAGPRRGLWPRGFRAGIAVARPMLRRP
jgi:hypothetical protein